MIWIFLPAYNEEQSLPVLLPKIARLMQERDVDYQMVVVNDGSIDQTSKILDDFSGKLPLHVIHHPINRGLGETERDGFEYVASQAAPNDVLVRVEGDDTHEPEYIFTLWQKLEEGYDVVNTSRFQPGGGQLGLDSYRALISRFANIFMQVVFGIPGIRDYSCGYRLYRVQVIKDAIDIFGNNLVQLRGLGFTSTLEILVKLHMMGCRFAEVPFILHYEQKRGTSKMVGSITTLGYFVMALLYHWPLGGWRNQYRGLPKLYRLDPSKAVECYNLNALTHRHRVSNISF